MSHLTTNTSIAVECLCEAYRKRRLSVLTVNKVTGIIQVIPPPVLNVRLGCHYESETCPMAIKRKDASNGVVKDTSWLNDPQAGALIHHLVVECSAEKIMVSFSVTRLGDFSTTLVFGKGETQKMYAGNLDEFFVQVVEVTGGSGETEMYTKEGEVLSPVTMKETARKPPKMA